MVVISNKEDKVLWRESERLATNADGTFDIEYTRMILERKRKQLMEEKLQAKQRRKVMKNSI